MSDNNNKLDFGKDLKDNMLYDIDIKVEVVDPENDDCGINYIEISALEQNSESNIEMESDSTKELQAMTPEIKQTNVLINGVDTGLTSITCHICDKRFFVQSIYQDHLKTHGICQICKITFKKSSELKVHMRCHDGKKVFTCEFCNKSFSQGYRLKVHKAKHTGQKPFTCNVCQKTFAANHRLKVHMMFHSETKPYSCELCNKSFVDSNKLKVHMRSHTGDKPYVCEICNMKFALNCNLQTHIRTHTGERPFPCDLCEKKFTKVHNLSMHKLSHSGEKPFGCTLCEMKFGQKRALSRHIRKDHGFICSFKLPSFYTKPRLSIVDCKSDGIGLNGEDKDACSSQSLKIKTEPSEM